MRISEGVPRGRFVKPYNPEMFSEGEELIVFTRDEFNRTYTSIFEQIVHIDKTNLYMDRDEEWKLMGYWPKIMERVHILDLNMDLIFKNELLQSYLDAYLYNTAQNPKKNIAISQQEGIVKL